MVEQQGSWQAVLSDAPKILAILDHFYHPGTSPKFNSSEVLVPELRMLL